MSTGINEYKILVWVYKIMNFVTVVGRGTPSRA